MYPSCARLGASRSPQHVQVETPCRRVGEPHRTAVWLKDGVRILERVNFGKKIIGGSKLFGRNITQALTQVELLGETRTIQLGKAPLQARLNLITSIGHQ